MKHKIAFALLIIGGLNWLVLGLFDQELGGWLLGGMDSTASTVLYVLVGLAAIYELAIHKKICKKC